MVLVILKNARTQINVNKSDLLSLWQPLVLYLLPLSCHQSRISCFIVHVFTSNNIFFILQMLEAFEMHDLKIKDSLLNPPNLWVVTNHNDFMEDVSYHGNRILLQEFHSSLWNHIKIFKNMHIYIYIYGSVNNLLNVLIRSICREVLMVIHYLLYAV